MESERYSRNLLVSEFTERHQQLLREARVLVVGAGGLGSAALNYLTAVGMGRVGIVEFDTLSVSNLQRQVLYGVSDIGFDKIFSAVSRLKLMNPEVDFGIHKVRFSEDNGAELLADYDIIVDCSDNYQTRLAIDVVSERCQKPMVYGTAQEWSGQVATFMPDAKTRYTALFGDSMEQAAAVGVISPIVGVIGALQAVEAVKMITGFGDTLAGKLLVYNGLESRFDVFNI